MDCSKGNKGLNFRNYRKIYTNIFFSIFLFIDLFIKTISRNEFHINIYGSNYITLKINGTGVKNFLTSNIGEKGFPSNNFPNEIHINEIRKNISTSKYNFSQQENRIKLVWYNNIDNSAYMFYFCPDITEIDLSNFVSSNINLMTYMFGKCSSLTSINLTNFNTSKATKINRLFEGCSSLTSLDLSSFDTSNILWMNHMFFGCSSLTSINITNFNTSKTTDMEYLFADCKLLKSIDLSKLTTSSARYHQYMFLNCVSLTSLDLSNFDTSQITRMDGMFSNCISLKSLNLSNFYIPKIIYIHEMFSGCSSLEYLDISNFNISNITNLESMFSGCKSLTSLNLSSFNTSVVTNMNNMFKDCSSLISLDLSNFDTSNVERMQNMFDGCTKLEYINLNNFSEYSLIKEYSYDIFKNVSNNITLCINDNINIIMDEIMKIKCYNILCSNNWLYLQQKKIEEKNCTYTLLNKYEDDRNYIENCTNGYYIDNNNIIRCKCQDDNFCLFCSNDYLIQNVCPSCNEYFFPMENQPMNSGKYINCYDKIEGYYLDEYNSLFKKCYYTCETCEKMGNSIDHNCLKCNPNFSVKINNNDYLNCYKNGSNDEIFNVSSNLNYTKNEINQKLYEIIVDFFSENLVDLDGEETIIEAQDNFFYQLTTTDNEASNLEGNNNKTNKFSKIDLGQCEDILREKYNIDKNLSLLILKYEKISNISSERNLQFEIYEPINKTRLNLSFCNNVSIDVYVPVKLSEQFLEIYNELKNSGYDMFDINSDFYQDICTPFKSPNGADILLSDRVNYYFNNEETQCQPNCQFSEYSFEKQNLKCECDVENSEINFDNNYNINNQISSKVLYSSFYDVLKYSNYKVLKCYKLAFSLKIFKNNFGNIIVLGYFAIFFILIIIYCIKGIKELKNDISKNILINDDESNKVEKIKNKDADIKKVIKVKPIKNKAKIVSRKLINKKINDKTSNFEKSRKKHSNKDKIIYNFPPKKELKKRLDFSNENKSLNNNKSNSKNIILELNKKQKKFKYIEPTITKEKLDHYELNELEYNKAIYLDKRNLFEIYWSFLRREHLIIFTFFIRDDHNITYVKLSRFIFIACTDMALNVFFFSDETMHKMFLDYGKYNFVQQIPQILYSSIVSQLIEIILCYLSLTDKHYYKIKNLKIKNRITTLQIIKCIQLKIFFFYIFTGILFLFYWYLITCFCAVYENTQTAFIKDSFISFALGLLYPFIIYIIPALLRTISIYCCKGKLCFVYKLSDIIPFF